MSIVCLELKTWCMMFSSLTRIFLGYYHSLCRKGNGWDDGSYIEIKSETGVLLFKGQCIQGKLQRYRVRCT